MRPGDAYGEGMMNANGYAAALAILTGKPARAICVWCLHAHDPHEQHPARRIPAGGVCSLCPYDGPDMLVATIPGLPECPVQALTIALVERRLASVEGARAA
jgi:hypothetical protein